jgi:glycosyltransferase involved in cell wall biosynthesis
MRVAFITFEYPPFIAGGAGTYAINVTYELAKQGHEVTVFTPKNNSIESTNYNENLKVFRVALKDNLPFRALQFWLKLPEAIKNIESCKKFDIIHFNGLSYWFLKNKLSKAPHIITIHHLVTDAIKCNSLGRISRFCDISGENNFFIPFIEKRSVKCADKIISVSKFTKKQIVETYMLNPEKINVIYNGIELKEQTFTEDELEKLNKKFCIPQKPVILFVGRVDDPRKGLDLLLKSFKNVLEKIVSILLVVGKGNQTDARTLATSLGIQDNVFFTGFLDEITLKKCYALCDVYVVPSRLEGFGLTILEAMAAGKPVVATNVGAITEIMKDGENGISVELMEINGLSNAICTLLQNKNLSEDMGSRNANYVKKHFSWEKTAKETEQIYMQLSGV